MNRIGVVFRFLAGFFNCFCLVYCVFLLFGFVFGKVFKHMYALICYG